MAPPEEIGPVRLIIAAMTRFSPHFVRLRLSMAEFGRSCLKEGLRQTMFHE
jgi:hypothetical protein